MVRHEIQDCEIGRDHIGGPFCRQVCMRYFAILQFVAAMGGQVGQVFLAWFINQDPEFPFGIGFRVNAGTRAEIEYCSAIRRKLVYEILKPRADFGVSRRGKHKVVIRFSTMHDRQPGRPIFQIIYTGSIAG